MNVQQLLMLSLEAVVMIAILLALFRARSVLGLTPLYVVTGGFQYLEAAVTNGSTTVISPPDGDMRDFVAQLHRLAGEPFDYILPAHGHVIASGKKEVARLIAHRMAREAKVLDALRAASGPATLDELVLTAYDDVDPVIRPVAKRSLKAHLLKLRDDGVATLDGEHWRLA